MHSSISDQRKQAGVKPTSRGLTLSLPLQGKASWKSDVEKGDVYSSALQVPVVPSPSSSMYTLARSLIDCEVLLLCLWDLTVFNRMTKALLCGQVAASIHSLTQ